MVLINESPRALHNPDGHSSDRLSIDVGPEGEWHPDLCCERGQSSHRPLHALEEIRAATPRKTVLEAAEDVAVKIDYSCRVGTCGTCKTKLLSGSVTMEAEEGLNPGDMENGWILACQAKARSDIAVEA